MSDSPTQPGPKRSFVWNLDIPIGLELLVQFSGEQARLKSQYLGMRTGEFLIVLMPGAPGIREKLALGGDMIVRFMIAGVVYGFKSSILGHVLKPCPMIFMSHPTVIETLNLRKSERVSVFLDAKGRIGGDVLLGMIVDLSSGGCRYTVQRSSGLTWPTMELGDKLVLETLVSGSAPVFLTAELVSLKKDLDQIQLGLKFLYGDADAESKTRIEEYIHNIQSFMKGA